jgi:hypothetical protein
MSKLNTVDVPKSGGGVPKTLQPGNQVCQIYSVELKPSTFKEGGYDLLLNMVGPDLGDDFQGFFIDKNNESLGRHKGQVGRVKATEWLFADGETKGGIKISRNTEILKWLNSFCEAIGKKDWLTAQNNKHETIESLINAFATDKPFKGLKLELCIAGKEYLSKGYTNFDLFLPKFTKAGAPYALEGGKVAVFSEATHLIKKKVESIANFNPNEESSSPMDIGSDFEL